MDTMGREENYSSCQIYILHMRKTKWRKRYFHFDRNHAKVISAKYPCNGSIIKMTKRKKICLSFINGVLVVR